MTTDDIMALARDAGLLPDISHPAPQTRHLAEKQRQIERFAHLVRAAALEEAVELLEDYWRFGDTRYLTAAIRQLKDKT